MVVPSQEGPWPSPSPLRAGLKPGPDPFGALGTILPARAGPPPWLAPVGGFCYKDIDDPNQLEGPCYSPARTTAASTLAEAAQELEKFRTIVETAELGVVTINENHEVIYLNRAAEKMFGYDRAEILGGDLSPLIPSEHRARHRHYVERYVRTRRGKMIGHTAELEAERK